MTFTSVTKSQLSGSGHKYNDTTTDSASCSEICIFYAVANVIICVLGVTGNGLVIWIAGFKVKKTVISTWYLSLAMSDFLYCSFLPYSVISMVRKAWDIGLVVCKIISFLQFLNMFSSIFLLVIISVDRCVVVMFPVWAQNQRTVKKASTIVVLAWIFSAVLSSPSAVYRKANYEKSLESSVCSSDFKDQYLLSIVVCRFIFSFVFPILIIVVCYVLIIRKLNTNQMARSKKPFKIMTALIVCFFICWLPIHTVALMKINKKYHSSLYTAFVFSKVFSNVNSCLNPFLYAFMGKDFKKECSALLLKIESAVVEEDFHNVVQETAITASVENKLSTAF